MHELARLDREFDEIWLNTEQLPVLLESWQNRVAECLAKASLSKEFTAEFEQYMERWERVLSENRELLVQHQNSLQEQLKTGEIKRDHAEIKKKYT